MTRMFSALVVVAAMFAAFFAVPASAGNDCVFIDTGSTWKLQGDCTTDSTIVVPDGYALEGNGYTITAVQPTSGPFLGAVIKNGGGEMHVSNITVTTDNLTGCSSGDNRLRGVLFEGASGSVFKSSVLNINRGASGCQEGNAIEVRNDPYDGTHSATEFVEIAHNYVDDYQKTGILANGDVEVNVHHNTVGSSATQHNLAANGVQIGFGAQGVVVHNNVSGNQWFGTSNWGATGILLFNPGDVYVGKNHINGNADMGIAVDTTIYPYAGYPTVVGVATVDNNKIFGNGAEGSYGVVDYTGDNVVTNNKVKGYDTAYYGVTSGKNKTIGSPNGGSPNN